MIGSKPLNRALPLCVVSCAMIVFPIGRIYPQDADAVGARLKAAGDKLRAAGEAGEFDSAEEALAKWHQIKERIITTAVVKGEISQEEADMIRLELVKGEAAERAKAAPSGSRGMQSVGARLEAAGAKFRATVEEAFAKWYQTKERIITDAVAAGEISGEEADMLRREIEKAEAAELAKAANVQDYQDKQQSGSTAPASAAARVTAKQIVSYMDKNGDGRITKNEASEDLKLYFEQYDVNQDGAIDVKEAEALEKYVNREQAGSSEPTPAPGRLTAKQIISYMDKNGDGAISKNEASEELKPTFQFIDTNGDGVIDVKEAEVMAKYANEQQGQ